MEAERKAPLLAAACGIATTVVFAASAMAQTYPSKAIRIVVPFPAGGTSDILSRAIGQ